jgi:hypothetical protein
MERVLEKVLVLVMAVWVSAMVSEAEKMEALFRSRCSRRHSSKILPGLRLVLHRLSNFQYLQEGDTSSP